MSKPLLSIKNVSKSFNLGDYEIQALQQVSLDLNKGECLAIVGESGSGKSTLANIIMGIYPQSDGEISFKESTLPSKRLLSHRKDIQFVQQNPLSSINPSRSIVESLRLPLDVHRIGHANERNNRVSELLTEVGLTSNYSKRYPSTMSGGQLQRVAIARALACAPELVVLDEPTSSLDVLVQSRVLSLLQKLRKKRSLSFLFITHDLAVVRNIADYVAVFKEGKLVELNGVNELFSKPVHSYTKRLLSAIPVVSEDEVQLLNEIKEKE